MKRKSNYRRKIISAAFALLGFGMVGTSMSSCLFPVAYGPLPSDYDLTVNPSSIHFSNEGGTATIKIQTEDCWTVIYMPSYVKISFLQGCGNSILSIEVSENTDFKTRDSYIVIKGNEGGEEVVINIRQSGK